ncbi:MAG: HD domain-containing protein [Candidatus Falkowbacteria bacterium]
MKLQEIKKIAIKNHPNEYFCHVYFVHKIAMDLQKKYGGNKKTIAVASLLHDIGRDNKFNIPHEIAGAEKAKKILKKLNYSKNEIKDICGCILAHNAKTIKPKTIEEKIICSADGASKVFYHNFFGLLSKKEPQEKINWILKYVDKGYNIICIPKFKKELKVNYFKIKKIYKEIIKDIKENS